MTKKIIKDLDVCPSCDLPRGLCRCAKGKGGAAGEEEKAKDDDKDEVESQRSQRRIASKPVVLEDTSRYRTLFNENHQLLDCTLFASTEKEPTPELSNELSEDNEEGASDAQSISFSMGMRMGGASE